VNVSANQPVSFWRRLVSKPPGPEGSRRGLLWATGAFGAGVLLNADRVPLWVPLVTLALVAWRLLAAYRAVRLPNVLVRSAIAVLLVAGVVSRFHTLNGLGAGTALLALMGAVKLLETRTQRDQFIVVAAGVFLLLAACLDRQNLIRAPLYLLHAWLCCGALAVIATATFNSRAALLLAARSLVLALPLAIVLFVLFPRLPGALWTVPRSDEAVTGLSDSMSPGSVSELIASYEVAFRARFDGSPPPPEERYWRGPVLHEFDGYTWTRSLYVATSKQSLQYLGHEYHYQISLEPTSQRFWFALDTPTGSPSPKVLFTYDRQLISPERVTDATYYSLTSYTQTRAVDPLPTIEQRHDTAVLEDRNLRSRALARQIRGSVGSDAAYVAAVLDFLRRGGFTYSLTPPRLGFDSVDDFLFNTRVGFCGHYASAFTTLMRAAGLPARVVTGYLGGEWNPIGRYFVVRQSDAHAWSEVWLEGRGWTRVDPTGVVAPERLRRGVLDILPNAGSARARFIWSQHWLAGWLQRWDALNTWWSARVVKFNYQNQLHMLERFGFESPDARQLGLAFAAGLVAWMLWIAWQVGRVTPRARPDKLARAYATLCRKLARAGVARESHQGPLALASEISRYRPDLAVETQALVMHYAQLRYGRPAPGSYSDQVRQFERAVSRLKVSARAPETQRR
jgi:transglutaminase-like putative cysteine protease